MWSARSMPAAASRSSAIRTIGGATLPINRGLWNFDEVRFDFYRDANSHFEAFKKGLYDVRTETDPGRWETGLRCPGGARRPHRQGGISHRPAEDLLRPRLQHPPADLCRHPRARGDRDAVRLRMDQPQLSSSIATGAPASYFEGSELSARGRPADARERALLAAVSRRGARRRDGRHLAAAGERRLRTRPRGRSSARSRCSQPPATSSRHGAAARARPAGRSPSRSWSPPGTRSGSALAFARDLQARRHRGARARGRCRAIRPAPNRLRFRHDPESLGPVALARQRAGVLLGLGRRRRRRHAATTWASRARRSTP